MELNINSTVKLDNGVEMPIFGLGTWTLRGQEGYDAVKWAINMGYRLIDTASLYGNEKVVGKAISDSKISREDLFITTKVWNSDQGYEKTLKAFEKSLKQLNLNYVDLYLIHWPVSSLRNETWKALEKIYEDGVAKAIGISNFTIKHINELLNTAKIVPMVNQVEFSPFLFQKELLEYCHSRNIRIEAYSPLTRGRRFENRVLKSISQKYNKSVPQILLRWGLQHDIIEIPKSANKKHLKENADIFNFELALEDMEKLNNLNDNFRIVDDPHIYK